MISRRRYLAGAWGVATTAVFAGVLAPGSKEPTAAAAGLGPFVHRGRAVRVDVHGTTVHITVNGSRRIHAERDEGAESYVSHLLPFNEFTSAQELAQAVIDAEDAGLLII